MDVLRDAASASLLDQSKPTEWHVPPSAAFTQHFNEELNQNNELLEEVPRSCLHSHAIGLKFLPLPSCQHVSKEYKNINVLCQKVYVSVSHKTFKNLPRADVTWLTVWKGMNLTSASSLLAHACLRFAFPARGKCPISHCWSNDNSSLV